MWDNVNSCRKVLASCPTGALLQGGKVQRRDGWSVSQTYFTAQFESNTPVCVWLQQGYHQYMSIASRSFGRVSSWRLYWLACVGERACLREAQSDFCAQSLKVKSVKEPLSISTHAGSVCICVPEARPGPGREPPLATDETQSTSLLCLRSLPGRLICSPPGSFGFEPQNHT